METADIFKTKWLGCRDEYDLYLVLLKVNSYGLPYYSVNIYKAESVGDVEETYMDGLSWDYELNTILNKYNIDFHLRDFSEEEKEKIFRHRYRTSNYFPGEYFHDLKVLDGIASVKLNVQTMYDHAYDLLTEQIGWCEDGFLELDESPTWEEIKVFIADFCKEQERDFIRRDTDLVYKHI